MPSKKKTANLPPKLTDTQNDLLWHLTHGYQLETSPAESGPVLRNLKDNAVIRTASANESTIRALEERGLIAPVTGDNELVTIWRAKNRKTD
jgi:hypothetical protein